MSTHAKLSSEDRRKLKHDFNNDLNSLKLNLDALQIVREDHDQFLELIELMRETLNTLQSRVESTLARTDSSNDTP